MTKPNPEIPQNVFRDVFVAFLREHNADPQLAVGDDDNLFNLGLLDSFALLRLLEHLEKTLGRQPALHLGGLETFFTIRKAYSVYQSSGQEAVS